MRRSMDVGSPSHRETKWLRDRLRLSLRKLQPPTSDDASLLATAMVLRAFHSRLSRASMVKSCRRARGLNPFTLNSMPSSFLQVGGVVVVPAPEDAVAAAVAYRVEVPVLGVVDLLAEAGVGVLAAGAAIAAPTAGSTSAEVEERLPGPGAGPPGAASGWMVVKASGCAGQGILILAWLETRDHFNPFALRASEDFPVDVDRPT